MDISGFLTLVQNYSTIGYLIMFLIAFLEIVIFVGVFMPGQGLIIASGFLAHQGSFDLLTLMVVIFLGTVAGNLFTYFTGRIYGDRFLLRHGRHLRIEEKHVKIAKHYMKLHTGKTLLIGRFNPIIRCFIPFVAGTTDVGIVKFTLYTILGSAIWTVPLVMIGYVLGKSYEAAFGYIGALAIVSFVIVGAIFYYFMKKHYNVNVFK